MAITLQKPTEKSLDIEPTSRFHWSVDAFHKGQQIRLFGEPHGWELVKGEIRNRMGQGTVHATLTTLISRRLQHLLEPEWAVREEKPLLLSFDGEPVPDILVLRGRNEDYMYREPEPDDAVLCVEVADSSLTYDTTEKTALYAEAGISDYWVVDIKNSRLRVYRTPTQNVGGWWGYASEITLTREQMVTPLCAPSIVIAVRDLLP